MTSTRSLPKPKETVSSRKPRVVPKPKGQQTSLFGPDFTEWDLITQLSYMSAVSTAGISRDQIFEHTSRLPFVTSYLFRTVLLVARQLNYNYATACRLIAERSPTEYLRSLLLRFSSSLASGERESDFLAREAGVELERYGNKYERDLESLKKWTDAFVTLLVSVVLIVIITIVSTMLYSLGVAMIFGLCVVSWMVIAMGAWLIYRTSPPEKKTHSLKFRSKDQVLTIKLATRLLPVGFLGSVLLGVFTGQVGIGLVALAAFLAPVGFFARRYDRAIDKYDREMAVFLRALGSVAGAIGTTIDEAMSQLDLRSIGSLEACVRRLLGRLQSGIKPDLCWKRFVGETGSELVSRSVSIFWDSISVGGDPATTGYQASLFLDKMNELRAKRGLVSATFGYLMIPMHMALIGLMIFIVEIVRLFSIQMQKAQETGMKDAASLTSQAGVPSGQLVFATTDIFFIQNLVIITVLLLTLTNAFVGNAASGGDRYSYCLNAAIMAFMTGICLIGIPMLTNSLFGGILNGIGT